MEDWCEYQHVELTCEYAMMGACSGVCSEGDYKVHESDEDWSNRVVLWGLREAHRRGVYGGDLVKEVRSRLFERCREERGSPGIAFQK